MTAPDEFHVDMQVGLPILDTYDREILDTFSRNLLDVGGFDDVLNDILSDPPIVIEQGQRDGSDPRDRVADAGAIRFEMDNSAFNSALTLGYYSPDSANKRTGFGLGTRVRVWLVKGAVTDFLAEGRIVSIEPVPGLLGEKRVQVVVGDWIEYAARTVMPRTPVQESKADDEILQTLMTALGSGAPIETDFDTGDYTYEYALTDIVDEETFILSVLQSIAQSGQGRIFVVGGATSGEVLKFKSLTNLLSPGASVASFVNEIMDAKARRVLRTRVRKIVSTAFPYQKDGSTVALFNLTNSISIAAGAEKEFVGYFRDPNASTERKIPAVDVLQPVAGTDFNFSSVDGSGSDLNASLSILTWEVGAKSFKIRVKNNHVSTNGYLWFFQVRGKGLYPYDEISYTASDATIPENEGITLNYDFMYQSLLTTLTEITDAFLTWYSTESTNVFYFDFVPSLSDGDFTKMLDCKPGEIIAFTETVTGISYNMLVIGREIKIWNNGQYITERVYIVPQVQADVVYLTLDVLGQDELDSVNIAFGS